MKGLCFAAIQKFYCHFLAPTWRNLATGSLEHPVEAQYQDKFYRTCLFNLTVYLTSEWSGKPLGDRVNFQIEFLNILLIIQT